MAQTWPCGRRAAFALADLIGSRTVTCRWRELDRYRRAVARCEAGGTDLGGWMVEQGWALAFRRYGLTLCRRGGRGPRGAARPVGGLVRAAMGVAGRPRRRGFGAHLRWELASGRGSRLPASLGRLPACLAVH